MPNNRLLLCIAAILISISSAFGQFILPSDTTRRVTSIGMPDMPPADSTKRTFPWRIVTQLNLGMSQSFASSNWEGGQSNAVIWLADFLGSADKQVARSWVVDNDVRLSYGQAHGYDAKTEKWFPPQKTSDRIRFDLLFRRFGHIIDPYVAGAAESQFVDKSGPKPLYLNPAELTQSAGIAHYLFNQPQVRVVRSRTGFGVRERFYQRVDSLNSGNIDVNTVVDAGAEWVTDVELGTPFKGVSYISKAIVFLAVYNSRAVPEDNRWKTADVNWDNYFRVNLTSILQLSLGWQLLYDEEIHKSVRFRENLNLGLSFRYAR